MHSSLFITQEESGMEVSVMALFWKRVAQARPFLRTLTVYSS